MPSAQKDSPVDTSELLLQTCRSADEILQARARELAKVKRRATKKIELRCVEFLLSGKSFAFELENIREILRNDKPITPLPYMPAFFRGLVNVRGEVVPLVDLSLYLGLPPSTKGQDALKSIIILQKEETTVGFQCEQIVRIREFSNNELQQSIAAQNEAIAGLAKGCGRGGVVVLDAAIFIQQLEKRLHSE